MIFFADFKNVAPFRESPYKKGFLFFPLWSFDHNGGDGRARVPKRRDGRTLFLAHPISPPLLFRFRPNDNGLAPIPSFLSARVIPDSVPAAALPLPALLLYERHSYSRPATTHLNPRGHFRPLFRRLPFRRQFPSSWWPFPADGELSGGGNWAICAALCGVTRAAAAESAECHTSEGRRGRERPNVQYSQPKWHQNEIEPMSGFFPRWAIPLCTGVGTKAGK